MLFILSEAGEGGRGGVEVFEFVVGFIGVNRDR